MRRVVLGHHIFSSASWVWGGRVVCHWRSRKCADPPGSNSGLTAPHGTTQHDHCGGWEWPLVVRAVPLGCGAQPQTTAALSPPCSLAVRCCHARPICAPPSAAWRGVFVVKIDPGGRLRWLLMLLNHPPHHELPLVAPHRCAGSLAGRLGVVASRTPRSDFSLGSPVRGARRPARPVRPAAPEAGGGSRPPGRGALAPSWPVPGGLADVRPSLVSQGGGWPLHPGPWGGGVGWGWVRTRGLWVAGWWVGDVTDM